MASGRERGSGCSGGDTRRRARAGPAAQVLAPRSLFPARFLRQLQQFQLRRNRQLHTVAGRFRVAHGLAGREEIGRLKGGCCSSVLEPLGGP